MKLLQSKQSDRDWGSYAGVALVFLITVGLMFGCSKRPSTSANPQVNAKKASTEYHPAKDGYLRYSIGAEPEHIDPGLNSETAGTHVTTALFEGLFNYAPQDGDPIPGVAKSWEISSDGMTYTFHLRHNAKWSDGHPVTAEDFVYAWRRVVDPRTASRYAFAFYGVKNGKKINTGELKDPSQLGVQAIDKYTLKVQLLYPMPYLLHFLCYPAFYPTPRWAIEKHQARWTLPENIVSNGPFLLAKWVPQKELTVKKNPGYWDAANVSLSGIHFYPVEDQETELKMYETGDLDLTDNIPLMKIASLKGRADFQISPFLATYYFIINVRRPHLDDKRIRQALSLAIDRKVLVNKFLQGTKIPAANLVPAGLPGYPTAHGLPFDLERARKLLAEAGYPGGEGLPTFSLNYNTSEDHKRIATVLQQMWKQNLGVKVQLVNEEWKTHLKTVHQGDYDIARTSWVGDYPDPNTFLEIFTSYSSHNDTGWKNLDYDRLLQEGNSSTDPGERASKLAAAEELLLEAGAVLPIYTYTLPSLKRSYVKGYFPTLQNNHPWKNVRLEQ